jgi:DNA-binding NtrC family response regulator
MNERILFVDDEPNIARLYERTFRGKYPFEYADRPAAALERIDNGETFAIVISDMQMPSMNGIQFLTEVRRRLPDAVRILLTGNTEDLASSAALPAACVFRLLEKPCRFDALLAAVQAGLAERREPAASTC